MYLMPDPKMEYIVIFCSTVSTEPAAWWEVFLVSPPAEAHLGTRCSLNGPSLGHEAWFANPFEKISQPFCQLHAHSSRAGSGETTYFNLNRMTPV